MKYFFDTEFIDTGRFIDLISIGIVAEDGRTYYAESSMYNELNACPWVKKNVLSLLTGPGKMKSVIAEEILAFVKQESSPEFWAYYADYDWVNMCQIFGNMMNLRSDWPHVCMDVKQLAIMCGNPKLPEQQTVAHHALNDALWTKEAYEFLKDYIKIHSKLVLS